jgi:hypothetical protein
MSEYTTTTAVWRDGLDIPWAYFPTQEETEAYIRRCQAEDLLEEEFRAMLEDFADRVARRLGIPQEEAVETVRALAGSWK